MNKLDESFIDLYKEKIVPDMMKQFKYKNVMQVPKITKVVLSMNPGPNKLKLDMCLVDLTDISGQQAVTTVASKSVAVKRVISGNKTAMSSIREGEAVGVKVTLRKSYMYYFLERLINVDLLCHKSFAGISKYSLNKQKNNISFSLCLDIRLFHAYTIRTSSLGSLDINITVCTSAKTIDEAEVLLKEFGFPINDVKRPAKIIQKKRGK